MEGVKSGPVRNASDGNKDSFLVQAKAKFEKTSQAHKRMRMGFCPVQSTWGANASATCSSDGSFNTAEKRHCTVATHLGVPVEPEVYSKKATSFKSPPPKKCEQVCKHDVTTK